MPQFPGMPAFHLGADSRHILLPLRTGFLRPCWTGWALPLTPCLKIVAFPSSILGVFSPAISAPVLSVHARGGQPLLFSELPPLPPPPLAGRPCLSPAQGLWGWLPGRLSPTESFHEKCKLHFVCVLLPVSPHTPPKELLAEKQDKSPPP